MPLKELKIFHIKTTKKEKRNYRHLLHKARKALKKEAEKFELFDYEHLIDLIIIGIKYQMKFYEESNCVVETEDKNTIVEEMRHALFLYRQGKDNIDCNEELIWKELFNYLADHIYSWWD